MRTRLREKTASVSEVQEWYHEMKKENGEFPKAPDVALRFGISNSEAVRIINLIRDDWDNYDESKTVKLGLRIKRLEEALAITGLRESSSKSEAAEVLSGLLDNGDISKKEYDSFLSSASDVEFERVAEFGLKFDYCQSEDEADRVAEKLVKIVKKYKNFKESKSFKSSLKESHPIQIDDVEDFEELDARLIQLGVKYKKLDANASRENSEEVEEWLDTLGERLSFVSTDGDGYAKESDVAVQVKRMWVVKGDKSFTSNPYSGGNSWKLDDKVTTYLNTYYKANGEYPEKRVVKSKFFKYFDDVADFEKTLSRFY